MGYNKLNPKKERESRKRWKKKARSGKLSSIRYCIECKENTKWLYDSKTNHSRCRKCGGQFSKNKK